jgi:mono/diheme cytochrome c family protein
MTEDYMIFRKILVCSLFLLVLGFLYAAPQAEIKKVPVKNVPVASGEKMYVTYCAACHGLDGKGGGPTAKALNTVPPDLTLLTKHNNGTFPDTHVYTVIRGDSAMPAAHGEKDMPVWGSLFTSLCGGNPTVDAEVHQRVANLTKYVESLQQK